MSISVGNHSYQTRLAKYRQDPEINPDNKATVERFLRDNDLDKFRVPIKEARLAKYITVFRWLETWFNHKKFEDITKEDFENWYLQLKRNQIGKTDGKPFSQNTKSSYIVMIRSIWKWLKGANEFYPVEVKNMRPNWEAKEKKDISKNDIEKISNTFKDFRYRFTTLLLFDSGFRIDEFMSMRKHNVKTKERSNGEQYYAFECSTSKTIPRTVEVPLYPNLITDYMKEHHSTSQKNTPLVSFRYEAYRKALKNASTKALGFKVTPHDLRKASATYYAAKIGNPYKINKRFGWTMSSDMGSVYINEAGLDMDENVEVIEQNEVADIQKKYKLLDKRLTRMQEASEIIMRLSQTPEGREQIQKAMAEMNAST